MKKLRYLLEYLLLKTWLFLMTKLSLNAANNLSVKLFQTIGMKLKVTNTARRNISRVFPELNAKEVDEIIMDVWSNFAHMASETSIMMHFSEEELEQYVTVTGVENLDQIKDRGILFFTAHMANWEISAKALSRYGVKLNAVYRSANNKLVDKLIIDIRRVLGLGLIPKGRSGAKQIIQCLKKKEHVVMLVDQKMNDGIKVPFLGHDAMTAPAIASLALKYDYPIVPLQIVRKEGSNIELIIHPQMDYKGKSVESIMLEINNEIGQWVKENPGQWFWLHNRWIKK